MQLHHSTREFLNVLAANMPEVGSADVTAADLRAGRTDRPAAPAPDVALIRDLTAPGPAGDIPLRRYHPAPDGPELPGIVFLHGGGYVFGDLDTHDHVCRIIADRAEAVVISVDYRLAPEHRFPAAVDDAFAATRWVAENAGHLGIDAGRLAIAGDSAGGGLAAAVALLARDAGGPNLAFQALIYPVTDLSGYPVSAGTPYPSRISNGEGYFLTSNGMNWFAGEYLAAPEDASDFRASPIHATELAGLPPALVLTADFDPLRDEGETYARALAGAGVKATTARINGGFHGMLGMGAFLPVARQCEDATVEALRTALTTTRGTRSSAA